MRRTALGERQKAARRQMKALNPVIGRKLAEMRKLDMEAEKLVHEADTEFQKLCENWRNLASPSAEKQRKEIKHMYNRALALSNKKVKLADDMYQTVDRIVVQLDIERDGLRDALERLIDERKETLAQFESEPRRKRRTTQNKKSMSEDSGKQADAFEPFDTSKLVPDIPVDPNEPTYCHCKQVSYGRMVMCDNDNCPIEWFHFKCVGLNASPKGTWYCSLCAEEGDHTTKRKSDGNSEK
ncbi:hypothetical protein L596_005063 [Steinernema carpocapsae]|uniref:Inhibitor of growth protein n=1 Tax=Steinernema carpocapsae TaxID=34508 RepID=A0A4U8UZ98_STECR|nr:hypothetical protein L596_005063 [Steinernema carpocapsae]